MSQYKLIHADCLDAMTRAKPESVDAIVTDPPYGLAFMGKQWDHGVPGTPFWEAALRVAKPGAHLLAFGGTRTYHRLACAIEDAGWEIRDCIMWVYGSGFPKSHDISKAIDKTAGAERDVVGVKPYSNQDITSGSFAKNIDRPRVQGNITAPATEAAKQWQGWGTALKPAFEPVILARKPFASTVAANVLEHGTGGLNIDGCRVPSEDVLPKMNGKAILGGTTRSEQSPYAESGWRTGHKVETLNTGRWPANFIHDGSDEATGLLSDAARFFYSAKASKADRDAGCEGLEAVTPRQVMGLSDSGGERSAVRNKPSRNHHPTVKPTDLMRYLCRLVTPPGGIVLDPFTGSGSTGKAAVLEGFRFIGIEKEAEYLEIAKARIEFALSTGKVK